MANLEIYNALHDVWVYSEDELVEFCNQFEALFVKYFIGNKPRPKDKCRDMVLDNVLKHMYGHDIVSLMNVIHFVKVCQMNTGNFMQELLGCFPGWQNLGTGHETGLDLYNESKSMFIELKNRYNTDNASSKKQNLTKLSVQKRKGHRAVYGVINDKSLDGVRKDIIFKDVKIEYISSNELFFEITGIKNFSTILGDIITRISGNRKITYM